VPEESCVVPISNVMARSYGMSVSSFFFLLQMVPALLAVVGSPCHHPVFGKSG